MREISWFRKKMRHKKWLLVIFFIFSFFSSCQVEVQSESSVKCNDAYIENNSIEQEQLNVINEIDSPCNDLFQCEEWIEQITIYNRHPFALVLKNYLYMYNNEVRAYLTTLDDIGTIGMLVTMPTVSVVFDTDRGEYAYGLSKSLTYIRNGEIVQIDLHDWGWFFVAGRYNRLMQRFHGHTHIVEIIYKIESEELQISTRLEYFSDEYLTYLLGDDAALISITGRNDLMEHAREKYGLMPLIPPNFGHMRNTQDQTELILALTINCVPNLDMITQIPTAPTDQLSINIGDIPINFAMHQPIMVEEHILAPVHELFDLLGFRVLWVPSTQQVRFGPIVITLNSDEFIFDYWWNRSYHTMELPAQVINGVTMVPVRALLEVLGYDVCWDEDTQTMIISS